MNAKNKAKETVLLNQLRELKTSGGARNISEQKAVIQQLRKIKEEEISRLESEKETLSYCTTSPNSPKKIKKKRERKGSESNTKSDEKMPEIKINFQRNERRFSTEIVPNTMRKEILNAAKKASSPKKSPPKSPRKSPGKSPIRRSLIEQEKEFKTDCYSSISSKSGIEFSYKEDMNATVKEAMEDKGCSVINFRGKSNEALFCLFDGHGGDQVSKYLQDNFINKYKKEHLLRPLEIEKCLTNTFESIDKEIENLNLPDVGSTGLVVHLIKSTTKATIYSANIGDTRSYIFSPAHSKMLSVDHRTGDKKETERIEKSGGFIDTDRVNGILMITRAFGDMKLKRNGVIATPFIKSVQIDLRDPNQYLIMACDGIWDVLTENEVREIIKNNLYSTSDICTKIINSALEKEAWDNLSVFVVKLS
ncbi:MAG: protein phosphatase 2C domain-containing protein [archaeon]|nr:protein phosphatase 2C domain-containing protein [archaeon]